MSKVIMITSDAPIDRRIILEAETLSKNAFEVSILTPNGLHDCHGSPFHVTDISKNLAINPYWKFAFVLYRSILSRLPSPASKVVGFVAKKLYGLFTFQSSEINANFYAKMFIRPSENLLADIIVAHDLPVLKASVSIAHNKHAKLVYDSHELYCEQELTQKAKDEWGHLEKRLISQCDLVITVNNSISNELSSRYNIKKPLVIRNFDRRAPSQTVGKTDYLRSSFNLSQSDSIVLLQGGLLENRNLETFIESARYFPENLFGVFLGDGPFKAELKNLSRKIEVDHKILFHDAVSQDLLLNITASATVGLIPYQPTCLNNFLCTPNKMFEYISAGLPIIATDLPEISKVVNSYNIGLTGDTGSAEALSELILKVTQCPETLHSMQMNMKSAQKSLNWESQETDLVEGFKALT